MQRGNMTKTLQERKAEAEKARGEERGINMKLKQLLCPIKPVLTLQGWDWRGHTYLYILGEARIVCTRCFKVKHAYHLKSTEERAIELLDKNNKCKIPHQ